MSSIQTYFSTLSDDELIRLFPFFPRNMPASFFKPSGVPFNRVIPLVVDRLCLNSGSDIYINFRTVTLTIGLVSPKGIAKAMLELCGQVFKRFYVFNVGKQEGFSWLYPRPAMMYIFREFASFIVGFLKAENLEFVVQIYDVETIELFPNVLDQSANQLRIRLSDSFPKGLRDMMDFGQLSEILWKISALPIMMT